MSPMTLPMLTALVAVAASVLAALAVVSLSNRRWRRLLRGVDGHNLGALLLEQQRLLRAAQEEMAATRQGQAALQTRLDRCVGAPGLVRFNAFAETGSDLSFALALLDAQGNGVVCSSLFGRDDARVYAKPVVAGDSRYPLTEEEKEAIRQAWRR